MKRIAHEVEAADYFSHYLYGLTPYHGICLTNKSLEINIFSLFCAVVYLKWVTNAIQSHFSYSLWLLINPYQHIFFIIYQFKINLLGVSSFTPHKVKVSDS